MKIGKIIILSFMAVVVLLASTVMFKGVEYTREGSTDFPPNPLEKLGWELVLNDEFDGHELDTNLWIPYYLEYRTTKERSAARYELRDGCLVLRIDEDQLTYSEGGQMKVSSVQTGQRDYLHKETFDHNTPTIMNFTPHYGYFEIRAKTYTQAGYHTAFWTLGRRDEEWQEGEIDIMEQPGNRPTTTLFNIHPWGDTTLNRSGNSINIGFNPSDGFNIYGLEWTPDFIKLYVNNEHVKTINQSPSYGAVFFLSIYENAGWTGTADTSPESGYPKEFLIDYFRAYRDPTF